MMKMILTLLELKPKRYYRPVPTQPTSLSNKEATERTSAPTNALPSPLRWLLSKDPTSPKRRAMEPRTATKLRRAARKRRDLRLNVSTLMSRRIRATNSRMVSATAMKLSARGDSSNFPSLLSVMSILPLLVFFRLKTQTSTS
jgi:hypothetical protein